MKFTSPVIAAGSGSVAGLTASRNKGGNYFRARAVPTNPNTTQQQAVRTNMQDMVNYWTNTLTAAQRAGWETYAANVPLIDKLGNPMNVTGQNMFVRTNLGSLQASGTVIEAAPGVFNLGSFSAPAIGTTSAGSGTMALAFTDTDEWANEDDAYMLAFIGRPQNPSINYFKGPYRYAGNIAGDATTAPTSPASLTLPFAMADGQRAFAKVTVVRADGRLTTPWRGYGAVSS